MKKGALIFIMAVVMLGTGVWGYNQYTENNRKSILLENQFQRMFQTMITDVENIQVNLAKAMVTGTAKQNVMLFSNTMYLSYDAQEKLTQLPIDHSNLSKTQKFLSQVGDLSMALAGKNLDGKPLSPKEMDTLQELHNYANYLSQQLISLQADMAKNGVKIGELRKKGNNEMDKTNENMLTTNFANVEERMREYPELIYDGPFSEHLKKKTPYLTGEKVKKEELQKKAEEFVNNGIKYEANIMGDVNNSRIPTYLVELKPITRKNKEGSITMGITQVAGKVMWMLDTTEIGEAKLTEEQGIQIAKEFLKKNGYDNMVPTYSLKYDGQMLINFAYSEKDVIIYSDLIKVKVGLDKGNIVGFEAEGYLYNHHEREIPAPKISKEDAQNRISVQAKVSEPRLAIIPTEAGREVLCYEFQAQFKEDSFLIYINGETGEEEKIFQVIIKDDGILML